MNCRRGWKPKNISKNWRKIVMLTTVSFHLKLCMINIRLEFVRMKMIILLPVFFMKPVQRGVRGCVEGGVGGGRSCGKHPLNFCNSSTSSTATSILGGWVNKMAFRLSRAHFLGQHHLEAHAKLDRERETRKLVEEWGASVKIGKTSQSRNPDQKTPAHLFHKITRSNIFIWFHFVHLARMSATMEAFILAAMLPCKCLAKT